MIVSINSQRLAHEFRALNKVVAVKPTLPVLSYALVKATESRLDFYATDLEVGLLTSCEADVQVPGAITLPVKRFLDIVENMPDARVDLTLDQAQVRLTCGAFKSRIQTLPTAEFPTRPHVSGTATSFADGAIQSMINKVAYAISDKTGKYVINAALLSQAGNVAAFVATDGKRLSVATSFMQETAEAKTVVPGKTLDAITALFPEGQIEASRNERNLFFSCDGRTLVSRMLDGTFPRYEKIIPADSDKKATLDRAQLAAAIRRVGMVSEDNKAAYFNFTPTGLVISSSSAEVGDAFEEVPMIYEGEPVKICASWKFVLDFLEAAVNQRVTMEMKNPMSPLLLSDGTDYIAVIMTMRAQ